MYLVQPGLILSLITYLDDVTARRVTNFRAYNELRFELEALMLLG
jgi:hypothetical protein